MQTFLRLNSLLTGKNIGNFVICHATQFLRPLGSNQAHSVEVTGNNGPKRKGIYQGRNRERISLRPCFCRNLR
jgi:hypothetical protein